MTEKEYQELVETAAEDHANVVIPFHVFSEDSFLAGAEWARRNPGTEMLELRDELHEICALAGKSSSGHLDYRKDNYLIIFEMLKVIIAKFTAARGEK